MAGTFVLGISATLLAETAYLIATLRGRRPNARGRPRLADYVTLSRGVAAAMLAGLVAAFPAAPGPVVAWPMFATALWSVTVSDWIDGPIARQFGSALGGTRVDLEADSWLTLWVAIAGVRWKRLPRVSLVPPVLRYGLVAFTLIRGSYASADLGGAWWGRTAGVAQMTALLLGLAPLPEGRFRQRARRAAYGASVVQLLALTLLTVRAIRLATRLAWIIHPTCNAWRCGYRTQVRQAPVNNPG